MSYGFCHNSDDHKREGREDFSRHGRYGYDHEKYNDHWNDCNKAYRDGFDEERRREDQRREEQEMQEREERRQHQLYRERQEMEQAEMDYQYQQEQDEHNRQMDMEHAKQYPQPEEDDLPF